MDKNLTMVGQPCNIATIMTATGCFDVTLAGRPPFIDPPTQSAGRGLYGGRPKGIDRRAAAARGRARIEPGLFTGTLRHRRHAPVRHAFTYPVFMAFLDIDRIPELMNSSRLTSYNRWNWASFDERDHFGDPSRPLRARVADDARRAGVAPPDGPIFLLTHLRYLGYCFNPVSFFYLFDREQRLQAVLAEVNNTFGGSHRYWLTPQGAAPAYGAFRSSAEKSLYVSPFMPSALTYRFAVSPPGGRLAVHMDTVDESGSTLFDATLSLDRRPWTPIEIRRQLVRHPAMTARVTLGIHWQALKLWWKGVPLVPRLTADGVREREASSRAPAAVRTHR
jgi:hypothetical protein